MLSTGKKVGILMTAAQTAAVAIAAAGILLYGYYLMRRLDKFLDTGGFGNSAAVRSNRAVLIFGEPEIAEPLARYLREKGVTYRVVEDPDLSGDTVYLAVAAVSGSDLDNLLMCARAKRLRPDISSFAVCNDTTYQNVFDSTGIDRVFAPGPGRPDLLEYLKGWVDCNV